MLETAAAVPRRVGGVPVHLRCVRWTVDGEGRIKKLRDEADNERMHPMTFVKIAQPNGFERLVILVTQAVFFISFFGRYLLPSRTGSTATSRSRP